MHLFYLLYTKKKAHKHLFFFTKSILIGKCLKFQRDLIINLIFICWEE